jgi:hypothetical protein
MNRVGCAFLCGPSAHIANGEIAMASRGGVVVSRGGARPPVAAFSAFALEALALPGSGA